MIFCLCPQSSYIEVMPSPNKVLTDHPLSTFVKTEVDDIFSCVASAMKQEVESELPAVKTEEVLTDVQSEQTEA